MPKWFDLNDPSGAKLKLFSINDVPHLFIEGLPHLSMKTRECVQKLGFRTVPSRRYLVRQAQAGERLTQNFLARVFKDVKTVEISSDEFILNVSGKGKSKAAQRVEIDLRGMTRLGRNADGNQVFESPSGRFALLDGGQRRAETRDRPFDVLRLSAEGDPLPEGQALKQAVLEVARGFVRSMDAGEVQHSEDYAVFREALFGVERERLLDDAKARKERGELTEDEVLEVDKAFTLTCNNLLRAGIDAALLKHVAETADTPTDAYGPMARLYDYLPPYEGSARGAAAIPQPLNVAAQRLLGDTAGKTVLFPQAYDGASFAFLPAQTNIRACQSPGDFDVFRLNREKVDWVAGYSPLTETSADALFFNMDPKAGREEYRHALQAVRSLSVGARAVLVFSADEGRSGKLSSLSARFVEGLSRSFSIDGVFETAPILSRKSGASNGLRVFALRNVAADGEAMARQEERVRGWIEHGVPLLSSWDGVKSHVSELIAEMAIGEAQSQLEIKARALANETYQRPYVAFSKLGEARTMSPANLQASAQSYLTNLEQVFGPVDEYVSKELGMGPQTLAQRFSPEQIDAVAVMLSRYAVGRSSILADDTGIGKGRSLAAAATWANKRGHDVFFVTDRANLFSDLARDLNDIGEWDRFRPLVFNADGEITVDDGPNGAPRVLASGTKPSVMNDIIENGRTLNDVQANMVFLTYSQISGKDSQKAHWLKNQIGNALVIFDEAHIAAGSNSNIATQVVSIAALAKHVQFASATWAKTHDNLHIYQRALPASVTISTLTETMRKGGDSFAEIFSTMLSAEGALIRREHDLSKLEIEMVIDDANKARNEKVSDMVADVLGAATYISGEMQQVFMRKNADSVRRLKEAREVRAHSVRAKLFSTSFGGGSVIYQVMKTVQGALNAEHVADIAIESRKKGNKPVIVTDATGEALVGHLLEELRQEQQKLREATGESDALPDEITEMRMPTLRDALRLIILKRLSVVKVEVVTPEDVEVDDSSAAEAGQADPPVDGAEQAAVQADQAEQAGVEQAAPIELAEEGIDLAQVLQGGDGDEEDETGEPVTGIKRRRRQYQEVSIMDLEDMPQEARSVYAKGLEEILEKINAVPDLPILGFDVMAHRLMQAGISVGEISGRKQMFKPIEGRPGYGRLIPRLTSKNAVKATIRAFNSGVIEVAIINRSAAAGVSMHASPRFADQSRRHLIEHQIPEDPINRVQLLGRVNRFDQLSSPLITTASTGIFGEVRYLMMQNRKLARMSANVRSSRDNAMSLKGVVDLFNSVGKSAVRGFLLDSPLIARRLGISEKEIEESPDLVNKLTMRVPLLMVSQQKMVYEDLYARFDEILVRAELDGVNPLRPHELNVRAATEGETVFFGDDSEEEGLMSAFDRPVFARKIKWTEILNPLSYESVLEASRISTERLTELGYIEMVEKRNHITGLVVSVPKVKAEMTDRIIEAHYGLVRLAHMSSGEDDIKTSVTKHPAAKRAYIKYDWMKNNLPFLVPGAKIGVHTAEPQGQMQMGAVVITDVKPPESEKDWMDAGKWRITTVTTGDERARSYTLRSLLSAVAGEVRLGEVTGDLLVTRTGPYFGPGLFGVDQNTLRNMFEFSPSGRRTRQANVLTGNMYLAAEWAAAVGKGKAINYTDDAGQRHRVIQLPSEMDNLDPRHLPVRLADPAMIQRFLTPLLFDGVPVTQDPEQAPVGDEHEAIKLDTSFRSAMAHTSLNLGAGAAKRDAVLAILPGRMIAMSCSPKDARRIRSALASGQKAMRHALLGERARAQDDPCNVDVRMHTAAKEIQRLPRSIAQAMSGVTVMRRGDLLGVDGVHTAETAKESKASVITMRFKTPDQAQRAIELIRTYSGLELYATLPEQKALARETIREVMAQRRAQAERMRLDARRQIDEAAGLVPAEAGNGAPQEAKVSAGAEGRPKDASNDSNESGAEEAEVSAVASEVTDGPA